MSVLGRLFKWSCEISDRVRDRGLAMPADVDAVCDVAYAGGGKYNLLDVYRTAGERGKLPAIINVHGGGYVYATKRVYKYYGASMAQRGFVFVNPNYHLAPRFKFPTQLSEINAVVAWLLENADKYGIDTDNIFIVGDSAGAQIASHYAAICTQPEFAALFPFAVPHGFKIRAVAFSCGIYEFPVGSTSLRSQHAKIGLNVKPLAVDYLGRDFARHGESINVIGHIGASFPPTLIVTSEHDFLKDQALPFYEKLRTRGAACEYRLYGSKSDKKVAHVFNINVKLGEATRCNDDTAKFFQNSILTN